MKNKRKARILALYALYACDMRPQDSAESLFDGITQQYKFAQEAVVYARNLIYHYNAQKVVVDGVLQKHTSNWNISRMAAIDRNIMRMAITELYYFTDIPFKVVIDEAVEIAKLYGNNDSSKFVNGILDAVYREFSKKNPEKKGE